MRSFSRPDAGRVQQRSGLADQRQRLYSARRAGRNGNFLSFDAEAPKFYGQAVNRYFGNYELNGDKIKFSAIGSTMMAAPEPMMKAETEYFKNLGNIETVSFEDGNLVLKGGDTTLKFEQVDPE